MNNEKKRPRTRGKGGRLPKSNPAVRRETVNLDEAGHARFLTMFEQSGQYLPFDFPLLNIV